MGSDFPLSPEPDRSGWIVLPRKTVLVLECFRIHKLVTSHYLFRNGTEKTKKCSVNSFKEVFFKSIHAVLRFACVVQYRFIVSVSFQNVQLSF